MLGIGVGPTQLALVVMLAMAIALFLGSGQLLGDAGGRLGGARGDPAAAANGIAFTRFLDALVGGSVALMVSGLVLPANPVAMVRRAARPLLEELAYTLDDIAAAIVARDGELADRALLRARGIDELSDVFAEAVSVGLETTRYSPTRRRQRGRIKDFADAAGRMTSPSAGMPRARTAGHDAAPCGSTRTSRRRPPTRSAHCEPCRARVRRRAREPGPRSPTSARLVLQAAATAWRPVREKTRIFSVSVKFSQVRSTATDLLAATGMSADKGHRGS